MTNYMDKMLHQNSNGEKKEGKMLYFYLDFKKGYRHKKQP